MMKGPISLLFCATIAALLVVQSAPATVVTVENTQGMGVRHAVPPGGVVTDSQTYDKSYVRGLTNATTGDINWGKVWLQYDLTSIWATYGKANLQSATLTIWSENGTGRRFSVAGLLDGLQYEDDDGNPIGSYENWQSSTLSWTNAPGNDVASGTAVDSFLTTGLWTCQTSSTDAVAVDLAYPAGGTNFDQCARYTSKDGAVTAADTNILNYLLTDTDGLVTLIGYDHTNSSNQSWWTGIAGSYVGDPVVANGVIRDSPTLTLTFVPEPATLAILGLGGLFLRRRLA